MTPLRERLLGRAVINWETGCWEWTGHLNHHGYGQVHLRGNRRQTLKAHRASYEMTYGPIPDGLQIDHLCRVRHCINPAHLEAVTGHENALRRLGKTAGDTRCGRGHEYTPDDIYTNASGDVIRRCRACRRIRDAGRSR